ncbi:MAG: radical SAM protein [Pseudomonadota bacterium]
MNLSFKLTNKCNYKCKYCYLAPTKKTTNLKLEHFDKFLQFADPKKDLITLSGGEPTLHPEIDKILRRLEHHQIRICTNGTYLQNIIQMLVPEHTTIDLSFHYFNRQIKNAISLLIKYKIEYFINIVIHDATKNRLKEIIEHTKPTKNYHLLHPTATDSNTIDEIQENQWRTLVKTAKIIFDKYNKKVFYEKSYKDKTDNYFRKKICSGTYSNFIDEYGRIYPCSFGPEYGLPSLKKTGSINFHSNCPYLKSSIDKTKTCPFFMVLL